MALPCFLSGSAQGHSLIQCDIIADNRGLSNDHAAAMVDKKSFADNCSGMYLNSGLSGRPLGYISCPEKMAFLV